VVEVVFDKAKSGRGSSGVGLAAAIAAVEVGGGV